MSDIKYQKSNIRWGVLNSQSGQGLVEAIIAAVVVILVMYSLLNLGVLATRNSKFGADRVRADKYATEGLEALRSLRDKPNGWDNDLAPLGLGVHCFPSGDLSRVDGPCPEGIESPKFERIVVVESVQRENSGSCGNGCSACGNIVSPGSGTDDDCTLKFTVVVAWKGPAESCPNYASYLPDTKRYCVYASTYLTSWR